MIFFRVKVAAQPFPEKGITQNSQKQGSAWKNIEPPRKFNVKFAFSQHATPRRRWRWHA